MNTRIIWAAVAMMGFAVAAAKADCCTRRQVTYVRMNYRPLKPLMKQIDFAIVPVERAIDRLCYPVYLQKRMMQVDEDVQHVGAEMFAEELSPEEMRQELLETYEEVRRIRMEIRCYDLTHPCRKDC